MFQKHKDSNKIGLIQKNLLATMHIADIVTQHLCLTPKSSLKHNREAHITNREGKNTSDSKIPEDPF